MFSIVRMMRWPTGTQLNILQSSFSDQQASYTAGSWLRLPPDRMQNIQVQENCLVLQKIIHLKQPVSYA